MLAFISTEIVHKSTSVFSGKRKVKILAKCTVEFTQPEVEFIKRNQLSDMQVFAVPKVRGIHAVFHKLEEGDAQKLCSAIAQVSYLEAVTEAASRETQISGKNSWTGLFEFNVTVRKSMDVGALNLTFIEEARSEVEKVMEALFDIAREEFDAIFNEKQKAKTNHGEAVRSDISELWDENAPITTELALARLGVTSATPALKIKKVFIALVSAHHPDGGGDAVRCKLINEAYQHLKRVGLG